MPDLLDLSASTIEQLAKVRFDEPIGFFINAAPPKTFVFWVLREIHPCLRDAAWRARHSVVPPTIESVARLGDTEWCRAMLRRPAVMTDDQSRTFTFHIAAKFSRTEIILLLLRANYLHGWGNDALFRSAEHGFSTATRLILQHKAAELHHNHDESLRWASLNGHSETVRVLLEHGADVHACNDEALRWASSVSCAPAHTQF